MLSLEFLVRYNKISELFHSWLWNLGNYLIAGDIQIGPRLFRDNLVDSIQLKPIWILEIFSILYLIFLQFMYLRHFNLVKQTSMLSNGWELSNFFNEWSYWVVFLFLWILIDCLLFVWCSEFSDIFDMEHFKRVLADDVRIVSSLPSTHLMSRPVEEKRTPLHVSPRWIRQRYLSRVRIISIFVIWVSQFIHRLPAC